MLVTLNLLALALLSGAVSARDIPLDGAPAVAPRTPASLDAKVRLRCEDVKICHGYCGDGVIQDWNAEECDLGAALNGVPGSGCTKDCKVCSRCGDGHVNEGEECDLGSYNGAPGSGCDQYCKKCGPVCGNGVIEEGEECDGGNHCTVECKIKVCHECEKKKKAYCGNGIIEDGEECDGGDHCTADCQIKIEVCPQQPPPCTTCQTSYPKTTPYGTATYVPYRPVPTNYLQVNGADGTVYTGSVLVWIAQVAIGALMLL